jgi:hypothetical protein
MEMSQGNSPNSYLNQTKMSFFFFYKIREQEVRTGPGQGGGCGTSESGKEVGKRMSVLCAYVCEWKNDTS